MFRSRIQITCYLPATDALSLKSYLPSAICQLSFYRSSRPKPACNPSWDEAQVPRDDPPFTIARRSPHMHIREPFLAEFDREMANTRKTLERVPDEKWDWKPHPKSGTMGWLAVHVGQMLMWARMTFDVDELDLRGKWDYTPPKNRSEMLARFDQDLAEARSRLAAAEDKTLMENWTLRAGDQTIFT